MAEEQEQAAAAPEQKKNKAILFVIIGVLAVLILLIGVLIAVIMMSGNNHSDEDPKHEAAKQAAVAPAPTQVIVSGAASARVVDPTSVGPIFKIEQDFKVNLVTQTGKKMLVTSMSLELDKPETLPEVEARMPMIIDAIIDILSSKSYEEVASKKGKDRVKDEIVQKLNEFLIDGTIKNVFFTNFLVA